MSIEDQLNLYFTNNNLRKASKILLVAKYLKAHKKEVAAETIWIQIKEKRLNISIASVYNSLNWLVELGFAKKIAQGRKHLYKMRETATLAD